MKNKIKYSIFALLALAALAVLFVYKPQRDISAEIAFAQLESKMLISDFEKDSKNNLVKFLDKTLIIKGKVTENSQNLIVLDEVISCSLLPPHIKCKIGDTIIIKGKFTGYENDIITEIKMQECSLIKE